MMFTWLPYNDWYIMIGISFRNIIMTV